jgi:undecaprenyl-diphosphatase
MNKKLFLFCLFSLLLHSICTAQNWDIDFLKEANLNRNRSLDGILIFITDFAAPLAYSIPFFLLLFAIIKKRDALKEKSIYIIQSAALGLALSTLIKNLVGRPRPFTTYPFIEKLSTGGSNSFPSGHTTDAITLAASLSFAFPRWYVIMPSFAWALTVGYSRMHLGVHYPSDVIAAIFLGTGSSFIVYKLKERRKKRQIEKDTALA